MTTVKKKETSDTSRQLDEFMEILRNENLHELDIADGSLHIRLVRAGASQHVPVPTLSHHAPLSEPAQADEEKEAGYSIKSPIAGVFYRASSPTAAPHVSIGDRVSSGQVVCIVEAMKVMNEVTADAPGKIISIMVENGKPIEAGQSLFILEIGNKKD